jgi:hypothetical protein
MATLIINAPREKVNAAGKKSFDSTLATGVGRGYAIPSTVVWRCAPGCMVVVLSKDEGKRAEGRLVRLVPTEKTDSGIQRYDVHIADLEKVPYKPKALGRTGVTVVP